LPGAKRCLVASLLAKTIILGGSGVSGTPQLLDSITDALNTGSSAFAVDDGSDSNFKTAKTLNAIASEAKQSISPRKGRMDCFVASLLAMTASQFQT
jgi:hypothetical protein